MRFRPLSIKDEGLKQYLDRTAPEHNGFSYQTWREMKRVPQIQVKQLALKFGVNRSTIYKWLRAEDAKKHDKIIEGLRD